MTEEPILRVALPAPLRRAFEYLPPLDTPASHWLPGMRIVVPWGTRRIIGVILEIASESTIALEKLRRAYACLDTMPALPEEILELCTWAAGYYQAPIGEAVVGTLPVMLRTIRNRRSASNRVWRLSPAGAGLPETVMSRAPRQAQALRMLIATGCVGPAECRASGISRSTLRTLVDRGLVIEENNPEPPILPRDAVPPSREKPPLLNPHQTSIVERLRQSTGHYTCFLLEGVTGSGKTEVYLRLIEDVLATGKQALVLVPEIGLTPQTRQRFVSRFGSIVSVLHSGLSERDRLSAWQAGARGDARVVIGTRSAIFSPLPQLGVIIVDEEHDTSFKQQDGFRYSARDIAIYRARQRSIPVVLGSATPSSESLINARKGKYELLTLPERAGAAQPPQLRLIDVRGEVLDGGLSPALLDRIGTELEAGNQVLVFLNRRGWAPILNCANCGWIAECDGCDARLALHRAANLLWCHHCDTRRPALSVCPGCKSARLIPVGAGTERSEHTLQRHFPQYPIRRIDRDTMREKGSMERLMEELDAGTPCILVGTQILAKGHHFPAVTLVAIVDADGGLFSPDYRAAERTGQLLVQVAGRAGRAARAGEVLIQTLHPKHPWLERLISGGYRAFLDPVLAERHAHGLPPFGQITLFQVESKVEETARQILRNLRNYLQTQHPYIELIGPLPAPLQRRAGRHRQQLLLKHKQRKPLHAAVESACEHLESCKMPGATRWFVDVDPLEGI